ncbi:MAG: phosphatase PAP2 family protein [Chitinophagaceae bacterium]
MSPLEILDELDKKLFTLIEYWWTIPALDGPMKLLREATTWIPLYAFMLYWIIRYAKPYAWQFIVLTVIVFAITDQVSASLLKPWLGRLRPCREEDLQPYLRNVVGCSGQYGLPSSHAANHFGLATFWFWTIWLIKGKKWNWLWLWAALICYAQIYVGKHYPLDILAGAVLGYITGAGFARLFELWLFTEKHRATRLSKKVTQAL